MINWRQFTKSRSGIGGRTSGGHKRYLDRYTQAGGVPWWNIKDGYHWTCTCPISLKHNLPIWMSEVLQTLGLEYNIIKPIRLLDNLRCPDYFTPNKDLLRVAYDEIAKFMPPRDYECFEGAELAFQLTWYYRPKEVRVVLLVEVSYVHA